MAKLVSRVVTGFVSKWLCEFVSKNHKPRCVVNRLGETGLDEIFAYAPGYSLIVLPDGSRHYLLMKA